MNAGVRTCSVKGCARPRRGNTWCGTHYERWRRNGDLELRSNALPPGTRRFDRALGYERIKVASDHPLAWEGGWVHLHRLRLYEKIGDGTHKCHWCPQEVEWGGTGRRALVADHVDGVKLNNDPSNLVASCRPCNLTRDTPRVCQLLGCGASLEGMRRGARYCSRSHATMGREGKSLKAAGTCSYCRTALDSARKTYCSERCRRKAWQKRAEQGRVAVQPLGFRRADADGSLHALVDVLPAEEADHVDGNADGPAARCGCESPIPSQRGSEPWRCDACGGSIPAPFDIEEASA